MRIVGVCVCVRVRVCPCVAFVCIIHPCLRGVFPPILACLHKTFSELSCKGCMSSHCVSVLVILSVFYSLCVCMLCVCVEIILLLTTWKEAAWWEKLKENLILALIWQHFCETTTITQLLSLVHVSTCVCVFKQNIRHTHKHTLDSRRFCRRIRYVWLHVSS